MVGYWGGEDPNEVVASTFKQALREEFRRIRKPPYTVIWCIVINFVLVTAFWFIPWPVIQDFMFSLHKTFWFPLVMASWLLADVPATNELAPDRWRVLAALDDEAALDRLLRAKHVALWMITAPITVIAALIIGIVTGAWAAMVIAIVFVLCSPLCSVGIACFIGVRWPYHELPLKVRWEERRRWKQILLRWGILVIVPYGVVPALALIGFAPSAIATGVAYLGGARGNDLDIPMFGGLIVAVPLTLWLWHRATAYAARRTVRDADRLRAYLSDPLNG